MPKKIDLNYRTNEDPQGENPVVLTWFIPAFANSKVGSSYGIVEEEGTRVWSLAAKKSKNC